MAKSIINLTSKTFGDWTVIERGANGPRGEPRWLCRCVCGEERLVLGANLRRGGSKFCGTLPNNEERRIWRGIRKRCLNINTGYGVRGIRLCDEWMNNFDAFLAHIGPRPSAAHSVDRIDNDGNYEPGNVRWATALEQANNRRNTPRVTFRGADMSLGDAVRAAGSNVALQTARMRLKSGWDIEVALTVPTLDRRLGRKFQLVAA